MLRWIISVNSTSDRFARRWMKHPPYMTYYRALLDQLLVHAKVAIHLGAGGRDPATVTSVDLSDKTIYAVDPSDASLSRNPNPNKILAWGDDIPLPDSSVDVIFNEYLMEHVEDPGATVREAFRLLRPGGALVWVAPSLWSYSGLITHLTPLWFHNLVIRILQRQSSATREPSSDVFPTFFKINSRSSIRRILEQEGFDVEEISTFSDPPHYTRFIPIVHQLMCIWHLMLDYFSILEGLGLNHVVVARSPGGDDVLPENRIS